MSHTPPISHEIIAELGLSDDEYEMIKQHMGRAPNYTELSVFSVMWSEHCSYKSSRLHLKTLPTEGEQVIQGPGENAGVIDIGDGDAAIFKMESHNHPSFIEPYQGAATGVGGIMRDVFTMGARPIANMNALRFGEAAHPKTRHLVSGVVEGIGGYGNCMGVPTVGGEVNFDKSYNGNILVNAMCVGLARKDNIFYAAASQIGAPVVYVGSKTGRDGIHGATMASKDFDDDSQEQRPTVQVGDPFAEKRLLEACLELMASDAIIAIQDMGAAGLTSSSVEMADKGGVGIELDLDKVPCREHAMQPFEMLLSESQERMLMIIKPECEAQARAIFERWEIDFSVVGILTDSKRMVIKHQGQVVADMPLGPLANDAPLYDRPHQPTPAATKIRAADIAAPDNLNHVLLQMLASPELCSRRWIWEQYDHMVMGDTLAHPGGDAALVRVHNTKKALAISTDVTPRYVFANPIEGAKQAVAECWRNITACGATPLAITNCLNFGNPQRPEIMGQFVDAINGMGEAARALNFPIVSGNVSLYNETNGSGILPTPAIGGVGLIKDYTQAVTIPFKAEGEYIFVIGTATDHIGCSLYLRDYLGAEDLGSGDLGSGDLGSGDLGSGDLGSGDLGEAPPVNLTHERENGDFLRQQISQNTISAAHDVSDGGLLIALAEMALASNMGAKLIASPTTPHGFWFGEDQARYVVSLAPTNVDAFTLAAKTANIEIMQIGTTEGKSLISEDGLSVAIADLRHAHESWFPEFMGDD